MRKLLLGLLTLILIGVGIAYYLFQKKTPGLQHVKPDFELTSHELFDAFNKDEQAALAIYEGKVLQVRGQVLMLQANDSIASLILDAENAMMGGVNCSFNYPDVQVKRKTEVTVKGRCQGFLTQVVLNNCIIIPENE